MLWPRHTCPFGLPDDAEDIDNIILYSIGHALRAMAVDIADAPLPPQLVRLLRQLERQEERNAWASRSAAVRRPPAIIREPMHPVAQREHAERRLNPSATASDPGAGVSAS
jgi:hypothetical protein